MIRKTISTEGYMLSYLEANSNAAPTLFFIHGNSGSAGVWQKQLQSSELSHFRLIAFDLPGHGESDPLQIEQYNILYFSHLLAVAIRELSEGGSFLLIGFSMGANLTAELLAQGLQPSGIALMGSSVFGCGITLQGTLRPEADLSILFKEEVDTATVEHSYKSWCNSRDEDDIKNIVADFKRTKQSFRSALAQSAQAGLFRDELALLKLYEKPILVIFGEDDQLSNTHYLDGVGIPLWKGQVHLIPGGNHFVHVDQPEKVNHLLQEHTLGVVRGDHALLHNSVTQ